MVRGAWRATVHGVAKTQTWATNTHTHTHPEPLYLRLVFPWWLSKYLGFPAILWERMGQSSSHSFSQPGPSATGLAQASWGVLRHPLCTPAPPGLGLCPLFTAGIMSSTSGSGTVFLKDFPWATAQTSLLLLLGLLLLTALGFIWKLRREKDRECWTKGKGIRRPRQWGPKKTMQKGLDRGERRGPEVEVFIFSLSSLNTSTPISWDPDHALAFLVWGQLSGLTAHMMQERV